MWIAVCLTLIAVHGCSSQILPPKYKPGDVIKGTNEADLNSALDDVLRAGGMAETRRCAVAVANKGNRTLRAAKWYIKDGAIHTAMPYEIPPGYTGLVLLVRKFISLSGTSGIFSYDIDGIDFKHFILWSVPNNNILYSSKWNHKIYQSKVETNKAMYKQMSENAGVHGSAGWEERTEYGINLLASITDHKHAKLVSYIDSTEFDDILGPHRHADCAYRTSVLGNRCWRECTPTGWCWTSTACSDIRGCQGSLHCKTNC